MQACRLIVEPVAREFAPNVVFFAAGFDGAAGDPTNKGCYADPDVYHGFVAGVLAAVPKTRAVALLEGGYHIPNISRGVQGLILALAGCALPMAEGRALEDTSMGAVTDSQLADIARAVDAQALYWGPALAPSSTLIAAERERRDAAAAVPADAPIAVAVAGRKRRRGSST